MLTQTGFRRSQTIAYRPACENCRACVSVRVLVDGFPPERQPARVAARQCRPRRRDAAPAKPTGEQYSLFRAYLDARHPDGGMADMSMLDYSMMIEDSHIDTVVTEYRRRGRTLHHRPRRRPLIAACLTDRLADGLSLVYSFYAPEESKRSLGAFMILDHIDKARQLGLPHVYLGYWVEGSRKMAYKGRLPAAGAAGAERLGQGRAGLSVTLQHSMKFTASPPSEVSLYFDCMSAPV